MKILVLSLLRLGDVLMAVPALHGLRKKYPEAEIDLVVNDSFLGVRPLLPMINNVIGFQRKILQDSLVQPDRPMLESYDRLRVFIDGLNERSYDLVINLTQNKLSGYLAAAINAEQHLGLVMNVRGQASYGSPWFKFLNDVIAAGSQTVFHYSDIFRYGLGYSHDDGDFQLCETNKGRDEVSEFIRYAGFTSAPKIVVQALTSDTKKNWGSENWYKALVQMAVFEKNAQFILLGAPSEREEIHALTSRLRSAGLNASAAILSLEGALSLLQVSDLLVTGDTSIKHLACATSIPILEVSLGSSDLRKTGVYKGQSLLLKSREACAPCPHNAPCSQKEHLCAKSLSVEAVALAAIKLLQKDWAALRLLADEYGDEIDFFRTDRVATGVWHATNLRDSKTEKNLSSQLDLAAWQFFLEKEHLKPIATYGSESVKIRNQLQSEWAVHEQSLLKISLEQIENSTVEIESRVNRVLSELARRVRSVGGWGEVDFIDDTLRQEIRDIEQSLGLGQYLSEKLSLSRDLGLYRIRQLQNSLNESFSHLQIKLKLIRSLKSQIVEYQ